MVWNKIEIPKSGIRALYGEYRKGASINRLSIKYKATRKVIARLFKENNLPTRNIAEACALKTPKKWRGLPKKERELAWQRDYRRKHADRINAQQRKDRANNPEKYKAWNRQNYERNKEQKKSYQRRYNSENREYISQRSKRYHEKHGERLRAQQREYHQANKKWRNARCRDYAAEHREQLNAKQRQYIKEHIAEILIRNRKRHALERGARGTHTQADIEKLFIKQGGKCVYCRTKLQRSGKGKFHVDHRMPLKLGGSNYPRNLQLLCPRCNVRKKGLHPAKWKKIFMGRYAVKTPTRKLSKRHSSDTRASPHSRRCCSSTSARSLSKV